MPLLRTFRFAVQLRKSTEGEAGVVRTPPPSASASGRALADGAFQECSGLEIEMDVQQLDEGGRNDGTIQRAGRAKYQNIVLKRGLFYEKNGQVNRDLWEWIQDAVGGVRPLARYDGFVQVMGSTDDIVATWSFERGLPAKLRGPELNAKTGEVAIEELHIAHEGLRLVES